MTLTAYPNGISSFGLPVIGGAFASSGKVFFVDSNTGSDSYDGRDKDHPFKTLDYAVGQCTADKGDIIYCMPGHAETLAYDGAVNIDVAGVTVVGLGHGTDRPTFTFGTSTTADFKLAAHGVTIENLYFKAGLDALTGPIEVSSSDCRIINCEYKDTAGTYETIDVLVTTSNADGLLVDGFKYMDNNAGDAMQTIIRLSSGADGVTIRNSILWGWCQKANIECSTGLLLVKRVLIDNNRLINYITSTAPTCVLPGSSCNPATGMISNNYCAYADNGTDNHFMESSDCNDIDVVFFENFVSNLAGETGWKWGVSSAT